MASGFQFSDTEASVLSGPAHPRRGRQVAGSYAITQGSRGANTDYTISFTGNTLDITTATLTVTADPQTKVYGQADPRSPTSPPASSSATPRLPCSPAC